MASPIAEGTEALKAFAAAMKSAMDAVTQTTAVISPIAAKMQAVASVISSAVPAMMEKFKTTVIGAFETFGPMVSKLLEKFSPMLGKFGEFLKTMDKVKDEAEKSKSAFDGLMKRVMAYVGALAILGAGMAALDKGIGVINSQVTRFVQLNDPAATFRFQYAVDSLYATIGSALVPLLNQLTEVIKTIGSVVAGTTEQGRHLIAALAAGTVGLVAFGAAVAVIQTILSGGPLAILGAVIGAISGVLLASGKLQPMFDMLATTASAFLDQIGGAFDELSAVFAEVIPMIVQFAPMVAGVAFNIVEVLKTGIPIFLAFAEVALAMLEPVMLIQSVLDKVLIEALKLAAKAFTFLAVPIILVANVITDCIKQIMEWTKELLALLGIDVNFDADRPKGNLSPALAPTRAAAFSDPMADLRKAQASAFTLGMGGKGDPAQEAAKAAMLGAMHTKTISEQVADLRKWLEKLFRDDLCEWIIHSMPANVTEYFRNMLTDLMNRAGGFVNKQLDKPLVDLPGGGQIKGRDLTPGGVIGNAIEGLNRLPDLPFPFNR